jgi:hypothetical protein
MMKKKIETIHISIYIVDHGDIWTCVVLAMCLIFVLVLKVVLSIVCLRLSLLKEMLVGFCIGSFDVMGLILPGMSNGTWFERFIRSVETMCAECFLTLYSRNEEQEELAWCVV